MTRGPRAPAASRTIRSPTSCRRRASSSRRGTTRTSRSARAATIAARSASFRRCAAISCRARWARCWPRRSGCSTAGVTRAARRLAGHERLRRRRPIPDRVLAGAPAEDANDRARDGARHHGPRARRVGAAPLRLSVSARRRGHRADDRRPGGRRPPPLSRRAVPAREPAHPEADEAARRTRRARCVASRPGARRGRTSCIRSTFIAGFPGETEAEFEELLAFLEAAQLDRVGCFAYSPVDGAAANALPDPVPSAVREERRARFMAVQARISAARLARRIGATMTVLVDGHEGKTAIARSAADAPEIDGIVRITGGAPCRWATSRG